MHSATCVGVLKCPRRRCRCLVPITWSMVMLVAMQLLAVLGMVRADGCTRTDTPENRNLGRLRKDLLCAYQRDAGPMALPGKRTTVTVHFLRSRMDVAEEENALILFGYIILKWTDEWLRWDPAQYQNVTRMYVDRSEIWTPSIAMVESPTKVLKAKQALVMNGTVLWTLLVPVRAPCRNDPHRWPYDTMKCNVTLGNLSPANAVLDRSKINFNLLRWKSKGWAVSTMQMRSFNATGFKDGVMFQMVAERNSNKFEATVVVPSVVVGLLALAAPWLPADTAHRPALLCAVILIQVMLSAIVPNHILVVGEQPAEVLVLLRDTLLLSGAGLLQWLLVRWLPAHPMDAVSNFLGSPAGGRLAAILLLPSDPGSRTVRVAALADRTLFCVLAVVFVVLVARFAP